MAFWCLALGIPLLAYGVLSLIETERMARWLVAFPRNRTAAWTLCAIGWFWTAHELDTIGIEVFDRYLKAFPGQLWIMAAVLTVLTCWWMPNLLSLRGVSAIFMLFPAELFPAVRIYDTDWRLAPVVLAYICAITGMFGMFYPWRIRQALAWRAASPTRIRAFGVAFLAYGALLAILGAAAAIGALS